MHPTTGIRRSPENPEYEGGPEKTPSGWEHDASMTETEATTSTRKAVRGMRHPNRLLDAVRTFILCLPFFIVRPQWLLTQQRLSPPFFCRSRFRGLADTYSHSLAPIRKRSKRICGVTCVGVVVLRIAAFDQWVRCDSLHVTDHSELMTKITAAKIVADETNLCHCYCHIRAGNC